MNNKEINSLIGDKDDRGVTPHQNAVIVPPVVSHLSRGGTPGTKEFKQLWPGLWGLLVKFEVFSNHHLLASMNDVDIRLHHT
jgi:hypothetical protein